MFKFNYYYAYLDLILHYLAPVPMEEEKKELTELEKYWKAVRENPADFTGWTYLLQYVEQEVSKLLFVS